MIALWRPGASHFGSQHQILTNVFKFDYCYPTEFLTGENLDTDDVIVTDKTLHTFNADLQMTKMINYVTETYKWKKGQNIMIPMGCDFAYQNARAEFANVERMIDYFNKNNKSNMVFRMSTPSEYIEELKKENIVWPVRYGDAFPYADGENDYWSGYFAGRPGAKKQVKTASALMNA